MQIGDFSEEAEFSSEFSEESSADERKKAKREIIGKKRKNDSLIFDRIHSNEQPIKIQKIAENKSKNQFQKKAAVISLDSSDEEELETPSQTAAASSEEENEIQEKEKEEKEEEKEMSEEYALRLKFIEEQENKFRHIIEEISNFSNFVFSVGNVYFPKECEIHQGGFTHFIKNASEKLNESDFYELNEYLKSQMRLLIYLTIKLLRIKLSTNLSSITPEKQTIIDNIKNYAAENDALRAILFSRLKKLEALNVKVSSFSLLQNVCFFISRFYQPISLPNLLFSRICKK